MQADTMRILRIATFLAFLVLILTKEVFSIDDNYLPVKSPGLLNNAAACLTQDENRIDSVYYYQWDINEYKWKLTSKDLFYYQNGSNIIKENLVFNVQFKDWVKSEKYEYSYNDFDSLDGIIEYYWSLENSRWEKNARTLYTYDQLNRLSEYTIYKWNTNTGNWIYYIRYSYKYESQTDWKEMTIFSWNPADQNWINYYKHTKTFLPNGNPNSNLITDWDNKNKIWENYKKKVFLYTNDTIIDQADEYDWNNDLQDWSCYRHFQYKYNQSGKISEEQVAFCFSEQRNSLKQIYDYDSLGNLITFTECNWNNTDKDWENNYKYVNFYNNGITEIQKFLKNKAMMYPVPAEDFITIELPLAYKNQSHKFRIFNLQGEELKIENPARLSENLYLININFLQSGVYFISYPAGKFPFIKR